LRGGSSQIADNEEYTDIVFNIDDKNTLQGHYAILKHRLPQIMDESVRKPEKGRKKAKVQIKVKKSEMITQAAMERVLIYLYCGEIDYNDYTPFKAIEVMRAAAVYKIPRLMQMNERYLQENLTMKNIFALLKFSDSMNVSDAKDICIEFALTNADFFTSSTAENLGFKLYQEVTALLLKAHTGGAPKELKKRDVTSEDTIVSDFKAMYHGADSTGDVTFVINGEDVKAHRSVLADQSGELAALVRPTEDDKDWTKKIALDTKYSRITSGAFHSMLKFFYYAERSVPMTYATELVSFAKDYRLDGFYRVLEKTIGGQAVTVDTVLNVLDVAYHPLMDENPQLQKSLKEEGLNFIVAHIDKVNFEPLITMPPVIATHVLQSLQKKIGKNWKLVMDAASGSSNVRVEDLKSNQNWSKSSPRGETPKKDKRDEKADAIVQSPSKGNLKAEKKEEKKVETPKGSDKPKEQPAEKKDEGEKPTRSKSGKHGDGSVKK